jgi:hypothetical protein
MAFQRRKPPAIGVKAPFPGFIEPALATSIDKVPNGARWIHEIKFDNYRVQLHLANETVRVFTRRGNDCRLFRRTICGSDSSRYRVMGKGYHYRGRILHRSDLVWARRDATVDASRTHDLCASRPLDRTPHRYTPSWLWLAADLRSVLAAPVQGRW